MFLKTKNKLNILTNSSIIMLAIVFACCLIFVHKVYASAITTMPFQGPGEMVVPQIDDPYGIINNPDFDDQDLVKSHKGEDPEALDRRKFILGGNDPDIINIALESGGNNTRLIELMKKAKNGGEYTIACFGGSITYGALLGHEHERFGELVLAWFKENFPRANFKYINSGLGASNTEMGCYRIQRDLLMYKPDFVIVDFAVNLSNVKDVYGTYSTILYKILNSEKKPAVCAINFTYAYKNEYGYTPAPDVVDPGVLRAQQYFDIPTINYHKYVWLKIMSGDITWPDFNADYIHPNRFGHNIAGSLLKAYLQCLLPKDLNEIPPIPEKNYEWFLTSKEFINVGYITNEDESVTFNENIKASSNIDCYHRGWEYKEGGEGELIFNAPKQKRVGIEILFTSNAKGYLQFDSLDAGGSSQVHGEASDVLKLYYINLKGEKFKLTTHLDEGSFKIFGICVNYGEQ